jgi:hypothetical protein
VFDIDFDRDIRWRFDYDFDYDYGAVGFRGRWALGVAEAAAVHGPRLATLLGRRLTGYCVGWFTGSDRWFPHSPILLDFGGEQAEFMWSHHTCVSVTWNTVDPAVRPRYDYVEWTHDRCEPLNDLRGQYLWAVDLLEWPVPGHVAGVGLAFGHTYLTIADGGDWNRMEFGPPASRYRQHRIASMGPTGKGAGP